MNPYDLIPACEDNGKDEIPAEWGAVQSTDDGFTCGGSENDGLMALLKEFGF